MSRDPTRRRPETAAGLLTPPLGRRVGRTLGALGCALILAVTPSQAASLVGTTTSAAALESASRFYVQCANGYYWVTYHDGTRPVLASSHDAVTWTSQGAIFSSFNPPANQGQWAVRYQGANIIALGFNTGNNNRYYRNGTLNGDGTVTWNAADAVAQAGATLTPFNALVANQRPIYWRSTTLGTGQLARGTALNGPAWANLPLPPAALATVTGGGFSAAALFATGGPDPDDLIVLRATTQVAYAAGNHRLVSVKFDSSLNTHDAAWYNVSTLNGGLPESATTEVKPGSDALAHLRFAAVRDTSGNLNAVYVNRNDDLVHYRKAVGFNDTWSRISTDVTQTASVIDRVALAAVAGNNLYLFYSKSDGGIYYRRFDGAIWGGESTLKVASATPLQGALASMESANGCSLGLAWSEGTVSPYNVMFSLGIGSCGELSTVEGAGTVTVTAPGSFDLSFNASKGGGIDQLWDLVEDPTKQYSLVGGVSIAQTFHSFGIQYSGVEYESTDTPGAKLDLLEATPTRVRVRGETFLQQLGGTALLPAVKGVGDYSVYGIGRAAVRFTDLNTDPGARVYDRRYIAMLGHYPGGGPLNNYTPCYQGNPACNSWGGGTTGQEDWLLAVRNVAGARTDFLTILSQDWAQADEIDYFFDTTPGQEYYSQYWQDNGAAAIPASQTWNLLSYFKPTNLGSTASPWLDPAVISRSTDYRTPATPTINAAKGSQWQDAGENTGSVGDFFNESEAAYAFDLNPSTGLDFNLDGSATTLYSPFFKIRQWRSAVAPQTITVGGVTKTRDLDYRADVKPVSFAVFADSIRWHSTLQNAAALTTTPDIGSGGSAGAGVTYPAARYGAGVQVPTNNEYLTFPTASGFDKAAGAVEFWFQPTWASNDGVRHDMAGTYFDATNQLVLQKLADNTLHFTIVTSGGTSDLVVTAANYGWRAYDWVHIIMQWDDSLSLANQQKLYVNGLQPARTDPTVAYNSALLTLDTDFYLGNILNANGAFSAGIYDEVYSYSLSALDPSNGILAHGGLTSSPLEFLASPSNNATLSLGVVNGTRQGEYLYFGTDSRFRGLNVVLATAGAGTANLQWQFWNGTAWADLEAVTGFTDSTNNLKRNGNISWTADPPSWSPSSLVGGPDLYYVRAYVASGSYTTSPVESQITTDILLFQYCADVTTNANFVFGPPAPTAVRLMSFAVVPGDSAVTLEWRTGSELDNLGFHLYRGPSADGPWTRLTSSLIPGLGSSPLGQAYSWLDTGLVNGTRYYYRLEDVDTASVSTFHGPVSAMPAAAAGAPPGGGGGGGGGEPGEGSGPGGEPETSCPSWVLAAAPDAVSPTCARHGAPESVSLSILSRDASSATLELRTGGFWTLEDASGTVRVFVPGLEFPADAKAPALPLRRALVDAVVGKQIHLVSAEALELQSFPGLRPSAVGAAEMRVSRDGTVRPARRSVSARFLSRGYVPAEVARLAGTVFQGERKSAVVEITPVRFSGSPQELVLAGRVRVKLSFTGVAEGEIRTGSGGRALPRRGLLREVLAQLHTTRRGLYAVRYEALFPTNSRGLSTSLLRLQRQGEAVPFRVEPSGPVFGPGSVVYFFAERTVSSTEYSGEVAYELVRGSGLRMGVAPAPPLGRAVLPSSTGYASFETNRIYQPGLLEAPDLWLWDAMASGAERAQGFTLSGVDAASADPARLVVYLQGGSESGTTADHHIRLSVNGGFVGEATFAGKQPYRLDAAFPASLLREGANELGVANVGDTGVSSLVFLDRVEVSYPQAPTAHRGLFEGVWGESGTIEVSGLTGAPVILRDTVQPGPEGSAVRWITGFATTPGSVRFQAEAGHRYVVVSPEGLLTPRVGRVPLSTLKAGTNQADYLVIAPREFLEAAGPLLERRRSQGLVSRAVPFEEIASEFGHGQPSAEAIKAFLSYAYHSWQRPSPRYVLLLGDATYDPQRFVASSWASPLPALWAKTSYLWTASDPALAAVNGEDLLPDMAIGRLPATSREQAEALVGKLLAWEDSGQGLSGKAVLVADNPDLGGDFEADVEDVRASYLSGRSTTTLKVSELGSATRPAILDSFDEGASLMSYVGHGGTAVWASENVLNSWDTPSLLAQSRQPLLLTMNCLNGYFVASNFDALPEALLKAEGRGAIAAFSPSGLSLDGPAHQYHRAVMAELTSGMHQRLGDAILAAQRNYAETGLMPELLTVYQLLGDPAAKLQR